MVGLAEVTGTAKVLIEGRKCLRELSQSNLSEKHQALVNQTLEIVTDAQERLSVLQGAIIEMQQENESLRAQLRSVEDWQSRLAKFECLHTQAGGVVWREVGSNPPIYACPRCVESDAELHVLQPLANGYFGCSKCEKSYAVNQSRLLG